MKAQAVPSDLPTGGVEVGARCPHCGATTHLDDGTCLNCFLKEGLNSHGEASAQVFESVLCEADVPDTHWRLGNYEILEEIGRGGMGVIYRAQQRHSRRIVALKRVIAYQSDSHETLVRFQREAEAAASLDHPNILPIYEVSESEDGLPFFSMKYATGGNLRAAIPAIHSAPNECVRLMAKVARAIAYAHEHGILHRDLQPGNILLDGNGEPMVSDFGLAKWLDETSDLTRTLTTFGTPGYIAPEQAEDAADNITPAADIYSLGAILFHLLTGRPPFVGANVLSVIHQAAATPAPRLRSLAPSLDRDLETILARTLERDPKARYQTAGALAEDLERWLEGRPILARRVLVPARMWRWARRNPVLASAAAACFLLGATVIWLLYGQVANPPELPPPVKSIAVLPFENISDNKENSEFAAGIQDDLLTNLAQIHDLKVISRTSVMAYQKANRRNMRAIGRELGVANILEGSVRRAGNHILVNVQLIDARNDRHLWAERYDRTVADSIGLQGELATQIAAALKATLAPEEMARFAAKPTANSEAYVLYLTALGKEATDERAAEQLYVQATTVDPTFALAYARASLLNSWFAGSGNYREWRAKARAQAEEALRLSPTLGEAHMALGLCLYMGDKKYDVALKEFEVAAQISPSNAKIYHYVGGIYRRQGRWREAVASYERALSLDPRNASIANFAGNNHLYVRDWAAAAACYTHVLEINAGHIGAKIGLARIEVYRNANPTAGRRILENIPTSLDSEGEVALMSWDMAMLERDYAGAEKILSDLPVEKFQTSDTPKTYYQGRTALARGDKESAQPYFAATIPALEKRLRDAPNDPQRHALLGLLYAHMRRNEEAIREARRAVELEPESQDAFHGAVEAANLAMVYALIGEQDPAITLIERLLSTPGAVGATWDTSSDITLADLRLRWEWDSLRSNPRFQKILAGPEPKTNLTSIASAAPVAPEKSIAVLPFENLGDDKQNVYFAAGIQDDLLVNLSKVADLKVISRDSVLPFKGGPQNVRDIGRTLGVAAVLKGNVRYAGTRARINVQLIDTTNGEQIWAEEYDREMVDAFAIQSELTFQIASALKAKLSTGETARLKRRPTENDEAYLLYIQANDLFAGYEKRKPDLEKAEQLYEKAIQLDPSFALAYARLSHVETIFNSGHDSDPTRRTKARAAADEALRLQPDLPEGHMALAFDYLKRGAHDGTSDFAKARDELEIARRDLPNDPEVFSSLARVLRHEGKFVESIPLFEKAASLDPNNPERWHRLFYSYELVRNYPAAAQALDRAIAVNPNSWSFEYHRALLQVYWKGDLTEMQHLRRPTGNTPEEIHMEDRVAAKELLRQWDEAEKILRDDPRESFSSGGVENVPKSLLLGDLYFEKNDKAKAQECFEAARPAIERLARERSSDSDVHMLLGDVYAGLGRKAEAMREAERAAEIIPVSKSAWIGRGLQEELARIYVMVGEPDRALAIIADCLAAPGDMHVKMLQLAPTWDPLRNDPRFQRLLALTNEELSQQLVSSPPN